MNKSKEKNRRVYVVKEYIDYYIKDFVKIVRFN